MFFNWSMQRHFLHQLEFTVDIENHSITSVEATTDVISDTRNYFFNNF